MPTRPHRICPQCRTVIPTGAGCPTCRQRRETRAPTTSYQTPQWRTRAGDYLQRHPWCVLCGRRATIPDHHPISRRDLTRMGAPDPDADQHLRPLCASCHSRETNRLQPGGWHQPE